MKRVIGLVAVIGLTLTAITGCTTNEVDSTTKTDGPSGAPSVSASPVESLIPTATPTPTPTESVPGTALQAVAVATAGCYGGDISLNGSEPRFYPRLFVGALFEYGVEMDFFEWDPLFAKDVWKTSYMTQAFQTAATLDADYQVFADIWEKGKSKSIKAWKRGGLDVVEASRSGNPQLEKLEARCRVPVAVARQMSYEAVTSTESWVREVAGTLLPPDYEYN